MEEYFREERKEGGILSRRGRETFKRRKGYFQEEEGILSRGGRETFKRRKECI
jgi:hypothetical protein